MSEMHKRDLEEICNKINDNGFYFSLGIDPYSYIEDSSTDWKSEQLVNLRNFKNYIEIWNDHLHYVTEASNPDDDNVLIYRVDPGLFTAYPVFHADGLNKFFVIPKIYHMTSSDLKEILNGIVLVSHKLKMLSFAIATKDDDYIALWTDEQHKYIWKKFNTTDEKQLNIQWLSPMKNQLHKNYANIFELKIKETYFNSYVAEIFTDINDHWKNELLYKKMDTKIDIDDIDVSIRSAKQIIENVNDRINNLKYAREDKMKKLKDFEIGLYSCRIDADLKKEI